MPKQTVIDSAREKRYKAIQNEIESSFELKKDNLASYWWNIYLIRSEKLWDTHFERFVDWLSDFSVQPYGESRQTYYNVMNAIENWKIAGLSDDKIKALLGGLKVAIMGDIEDWFEDGKVRPEVVKELESQGETPASAIQRAAELPPGEARKEIRQYTEKDNVFSLRETALYDKGLLMFNVIHETRDGVIGKWTVVINATQIEPEAKENPFVTPEIAKFLSRKLGLSL